MLPVQEQRASQIYQHFGLLFWLMGRDRFLGGSDSINGGRNDSSSSSSSTLLLVGLHVFQIVFLEESTRCKLNCSQDGVQDTVANLFEPRHHLENPWQVCGDGQFRLCF
uniref:Uncharacterized protein n=1 Tax=Pyramimonas obovata TaxID=1411642 RepID=A0A7S0N385_9CHLO